MRRFVFLAALAPWVAGCHDSGEEHVRKGHVFFSNKDLAQAEASFSRALEVDPDSLSALEGLGNVAFEEGELEVAEGWFRRAIEVDPKALNARHRLAITLSVRGDVSAAITELERALALDPGNTFALHALGGLYQRTGDLARAEARQRAALEVDPKHRGARFALGSMLVDAGRLEEAERELTRLYSAGADAVAEYGFARLAARRGEPRTAARHLERALELGVTHPERILTDRAFAAVWGAPELAAARERVARAASAGGVKTSSTSSPGSARTSTITVR